LLEAYELNCFAFAPALGRFYANFRSFKEALKVFENYLSVYHDPAVAMQTAEIYCLIGQTDKIAELRNKYQSDSGEIAMLCCYYFDALTALANGDMAALKELTVPLRKNINTPVAAFLFFCADISGDDPAAVLASYQALHSHRKYLDLQNRADNMVSDFLQRSLTAPAEKTGQFFALAETLYKHRPDVFTAKFILLFQKRSKSVDAVLLNDALKRFGKDPGIIKIAIEHYFNHDLSKVKELITRYRNLFPARKGDILRYEIVLALKEKDFDGASRLFMENFTQDIRSEYWQFASTTLREKDLQFLRKDPLYAPFCQALLLLKKNDNDSAYRLLEVADAQGNQDLLFFAAKTLGENGKAQAALKKYSTFPENSRYRIVVLLNMAELLTETGDLDQALILSNRAYTLSPQIPETQLCYADKLYKKGRLGDIPDIIKNFATSPYRKEMETLWIAGMQQRIKDCNISTQREKTRELCRQLLVFSPDNSIAQEYLKKLSQMPQ
jgi:tetratricopeptide (TPR) repeat protein